MDFFSTRRKAPDVGFKKAVIHSLPPDSGLYFPRHIPALDKAFIRDLRYRSLPGIGIEMMRPFVKGVIPEKRLRSIMETVFSFEIPLIPVEGSIFSLELFHGPTHAFKDVGARFLAGCIGYFAEHDHKETTVLVATSGDTGAAVAHSLYGVEGVKPVILYPSGKVSRLQEKQLTTLGGNITALEIEGDFDDCQSLVRQALLDDELNRSLHLTSANSINIARWLPQSVYYAWLWARLAPEDELVVAVPSGNYGNITAGMLAGKMGFPLRRFIACSNANDVVPRYLQTGRYDPRPTLPTFANAMDVSNPGNFPRMMELYGHSFDALTREVKGFVLDDSGVLDAIKDGHESHRYLLDPHGAIGYSALKHHLESHQKGVFLETAHPVKFESVIKKALSGVPEMPAFARALLDKEKNATFMKADYQTLKAFLLG